MSRIKFIICGLMLFFVSACSIAEPFVDRRRDAGQPIDKLYVGRSKPASPVICYNAWSTSFQEVQKMADEECVKQKTGLYAEMIGEEKFACRLLTPTYAKFRCINEEEEKQ